MVQALIISKYKQCSTFNITKCFTNLDISKKIKAAFSTAFLSIAFLGRHNDVICTSSKIVTISLQGQALEIKQCVSCITCNTKVIRKSIVANFWHSC